MTLEGILGRLAGPAHAPHPDAPAAEVPPWKDDPPLEPREKPDEPYGFMAESELHACAPESLVAALVAVPAIPAIWTPETEGLARPEDVPSLLPALRERARATARAGAWRYGAATAVLAALVLAMWWMWGVGFRSILYVLGVLAALRCGEWVMEMRAGFDAAEFPQAREAARHAAWLEGRRAPLTRWLLGCLVAVVAVAFLEDDRAVAVAGLVKDRVWAEPFRLLTAAVLHTEFFHVWMNGLALHWLGRTMEAHTPPARLPLVFLVSALGGTLASTALVAATSVGASGGLMGMVGYLVVGAHRRPHELPRGSLRRLAYVVGATAALGMLGFALIDNAGHAGGFAAGLLLGRALVPADARPEPAWLRWAGWASLAILTAAAAGTLYLIFFDPLGSAADL